MRGLMSLLAPAEQRISEFDVPWGLSSLTGSSINQHTALNLSAVWACETLIADSIATLPADTFRKKDAVREETSAPAWVEKPNPESNRVDYETQRLLSLLGWGNSYSLLIRRDGTQDLLDPVIERWMLDPWSMDVRKYLPGAPLRYFLTGQEIPAGNIQHVRGYLLPGALRGMSVVEQAAQSMGLGQKAEAFGAHFYENGVVASGVLEVPSLPATATTDVVNALRDQFAAGHGGMRNSGKPVVVTGGTKWNQTMINPVDAQFLETRKFQIEEICRWFRVPPHEIQNITDHASQGGGNGIEAQSLNLARRTLTPWTVRLEQADSALLPRGQYLRYNLNAFVRADIKTRHEVYSLRRNIGMSNADELRALEDEPPIGGDAGQDYWQPTNMGIAGEDPVVAPAPKPDPEPDPTPPEPDLTFNFAPVLSNGDKPKTFKVSRNEDGLIETFETS